MPLTSDTCASCAGLPARWQRRHGMRKPLSWQLSAACARPRGQQPPMQLPPWPLLRAAGLPLKSASARPAKLRGIGWATASCRGLAQGVYIPCSGPSAKAGSPACRWWCLVAAGAVCDKGEARRGCDAQLEGPGSPGCCAAGFARAWGRGDGAGASQCAHPHTCAPRASDVLFGRTGASAGRQAL